MTRGDLDIVKAGLIDRMGEVCRKLLPDGREESGQWVSFNPVTGDRSRHHNPALKVRLRGGVVGAWKDWRSGDKGDALGLVAYLLGTDAGGALTWSRDFLGLKVMTRADREAMRRVVAENRERAEKEDEARRLRKLKEADRLFHAGSELAPQGTFALGEGTFAELHARHYFAGRDVPLEAVRNLNPHSLRFSPATEWWKGATWRTDANGRRWKEAPGPSFTAVHAAMRAASGIVTACHVTFLDPLLPKKAPVDPAKLMLGEAKGAVIEISMGPSGAPFWMWRPNTKPAPVVLAEGIETALSFAVSVPEARVWACGSLAGVGSAPVHLPCVEWVLFARDNNAGNPQAQKQFAGALDALERSGKRVVVEASHVGDDFNDLAQGEGA
jgi:hypothetical protein